MFSGSPYIQRIIKIFIPDNRDVLPYLVRKTSSLNYRFITSEFLSKPSKDRSYTKC